MKLNVEIYFRDMRTTVTIDTPSKCPHCGRTMSPLHVGQSTSSERTSISEEGRFSVIFRCSFEDCLKYFVIEYINDNFDSASMVDYTYRPPIKVKLPENIEKVSPVFVEIYSQATVAESEALNQIAGVGYRKAAEFLIKITQYLKIKTTKGKSKQLCLDK